ncbi:hypothetical protein [Clostridium perfringens]|uniref:hypothetical protein n=1 Tax=Clostridium perfringens TaxID=1502 RepID=UPI0039E88F4E
MANNYNKYPVMYKATGEEDYRAVDVKELMEEDIIVGWITWNEIEEIIKDVEGDKYYMDNIKPYLNKLITHK